MNNVNNDNNVNDDNNVNNEANTGSQTAKIAKTCPLGTGISGNPRYVRTGMQRSRLSFNGIQIRKINLDKINY